MVDKIANRRKSVNQQDDFFRSVTTDMRRKSHRGSILSTSGRAIQKLQSFKLDAKPN